MLSESNYDKGILHGEFLNFFSNGNLKERGYLKKMVNLKDNYKNITIKEN